MHSVMLLAYLSLEQQKTKEKENIFILMKVNGRRNKTVDSF